MYFVVFCVTKLKTLVVLRQRMILVYLKPTVQEVTKMLFKGHKAETYFSPRDLNRNMNFAPNLSTLKRDKGKVIHVSVAFPKKKSNKKKPLKFGILSIPMARFFLLRNPLTA